MIREETLARWGKPTPVLNAGSIRLVDYMGSDDAIVQAARVSYGEGTKTVREDTDLIRYLMRHKHYSPFASCTVKVHVRAPIAVFRQWVRHDRMWWSEISGRYSVLTPDTWEPTEDNPWRVQSTSNKQCSEGEADNDAAGLLSEELHEGYESINSAYNKLLGAGAPREQARMVTSVGTYSEAYVTASLGDWMLFLGLRLHPHAQYEIRAYAQVLQSMLEDAFPKAMRAFADYQLGGVTFSAEEMKWIREAVRPAVEQMKLDPELRKTSLESCISTKRERMEFWRKIT